MTRDMNILGFGAKIATQGDAVPAGHIFDPQPGKQEVVLSHLEDLGGTRHQSAARFVAANRDAVALVISQDRHLSVMHWDTELDSVAIMRNGGCERRNAADLWHAGDTDQHASALLARRRRP